MPCLGSRRTPPESLEALAALVPAQGALGLVEAGEIAAPPGVVATAFACVQMTAAALRGQSREVDFEPLGDGDADEMLALATLTEPGPFFAKTHRLGDFIGVRREGRLVAMAGERMKPDGFTEVSGVCTHPEWRGRGYAGALMRIVAQRILARGETAFLHSYADNASAVALYEAMGFGIRTPITFTLLRREAAVDDDSYGHG